MLWVDQHCSLVEIRPGKYINIITITLRTKQHSFVIFFFVLLDSPTAVSDKLRYLSTTTDILSDPPSTLQEEVMKAIGISTNSNNVNSNIWWSEHHMNIHRAEMKKLEIDQLTNSCELYIDRREW